MHLNILIPVALSTLIGMCTKKKTNPQESEISMSTQIPQDNIHAKFPLIAQSNGEIRTPWQPSLHEKALLSTLESEANQFKPANHQIGEKLFKLHCSSCHGVNGHSGGPLADKLDVAPTNFHEWPIKYGKNLAELALTISTGRNDQVMPSFGSTLKKEEIWALAYLVSSWIEARTNKP